MIQESGTHKTAVVTLGLTCCDGQSSFGEASNGTDVLVVPRMLKDSDRKRSTDSSGGRQWMRQRAVEGKVVVGSRIRHLISVLTAQSPN